MLGSGKTEPRTLHSARNPPCNLCTMLKSSEHPVDILLHVSHMYTYLQQEHMYIYIYMCIHIVTHKGLRNSKTQSKIFKAHIIRKYETQFIPCETCDVLHRTIQALIIQITLLIKPSFLLRKPYGPSLLDTYQTRNPTSESLTGPKPSTPKPKSHAQREAGGECRYGQTPHPKPDQSRDCFCGLIWILLFSLFAHRVWRVFDFLSGLRLVWVGFRVEVHILVACFLL